MLWGLFILMSGRENFLVTCHVLVSTAVEAPGLAFSLYSSIWVSTHTSPTPGIFGASTAGRVIGSWNMLCMKSSRLGVGLGLPEAVQVRTGAAADFRSPGTRGAAERCQLPGVVVRKKVRTT